MFALCHMICRVRCLFFSFLYYARRGLKKTRENGDRLEHYALDIMGVFNEALKSRVRILLGLRYASLLSIVGTAPALRSCLIMAMLLLAAA